MFRQSTATPFSIIKLLGQNISTGHKKCHSSPQSRRRRKTNNWVVRGLQVVGIYHLIGQWDGILKM